MRRPEARWLLALCLLAALPAVAAEESAAHVFCRMTDGDDKSRQDACVERQIEGARAIARRLAVVRGRPEEGARLIEAYDHCRGLWSPDYGLIDACLTDRLEGR